MKRLISIILILFLCITTCGFSSKDDQLEQMVTKGYQLLEHGSYDSAEACFQIAKKLSADNVKVLSGLVSVCAAQKNYDGALQLLEEAINIDPTDGSLYLKKAELCYRCGRIDEAESALIYADVCGVWMTDSLLRTAANAYCQAGAYITAAALFEQVPFAQLDSNDTAAFCLSLIRSGNTQRAQELGMLRSSSVSAELSSAIEKGEAPSLSVLEEDISNMIVYFSVSSYEMFKNNFEEYGILGEWTEDGLRFNAKVSFADLSEAEPSLLAVSPSGKVRVYMYDSILFAASDNELTVICETPQRLDPNWDYRPIENYNRVIRDSISWSADERYFTIFSPFIRSNDMLIAALFLVDTKNGAYFAMEAPSDTQNSLRGFSASCFDFNGENVYYLVQDQGDEETCILLYKYNIADNTVELVCNTGENFFPQGSITMSLDGSIHGAYNARNESGRFTLSQKGGIWSCETRPFPSSGHRPTQYRRSLLTETELILCNSFDIQGYLLVNRPDNASDDVLLLPTEGTKAERYSLEAHSALPEDDRFLEVKNAVLSPDGSCALISALNQQQPELYLLNLSTLSFTKLTLPDGLEPVSGKAISFLQWTEDDQLVFACVNVKNLFRVGISEG